MINQIEQAAQESSSLRAKLAVEKQILDRSQQVLLWNQIRPNKTLKKFLKYGEIRIYVSKLLSKVVADLG